MVCPQMRMMRLNSRMTMVVKPTHSVRASEAGMSGRLPGRFVCRADAVVHQTHEKLLEPINFVAHAVDTDALRGKVLEDVVETLALRDLDLERVIVREAGLVAGKLRRREPRLAQVEDEGLGLELAKHVRHGVALDDAAAFDDRDVSAQALRLFEIVRGQYDGRALVIDVAQKVPH